ncbi:MULTISPECIES: minor capsid protein [unclassified Gemella]|uniref:minor capsid protein n=1 Tax=unclassified Gemella TaxID=2624949 RepID=UPI00107357B8|nr:MULTISPECIES: minor capsid protein [unclassified Gemella]MBF0747243.1 minor capsid protein [Gemella sp. 19428wG2_WT2a]MBF0848686.1 minor capsid protein [Streptococcus danieliae]TFU57831.1 capsid protein [Gemella sp. WT2a]MBF0709726.1 minor capsid protein [Gemella sp. GL1.1]NYS27070.1 capsid protein [Gemella sp. GL1]
MGNDFSIVLVRYINSFDLPLQVRLDYFNDNEDDLVVNPIPGGKVDKQYMDGTKEVSLPFEIAVKSKSSEFANGLIWTINDALSLFDLELPSQNNSYIFLNLEVEKPAINGKDSQGFFVYTLGLTAKIEIEEII